MTKLESRPSIYGIETEYSCTATLSEGEVYELVGQCHSVDKPIGLYVEPDTTMTDHIETDEFYEALGSEGVYGNPETGMLSNGARFYIDPSGPEYDTPECVTAEEAVYRMFDGDELVLRAFYKLLKQGSLTSFQLNRRIVDHNRASRGIHINTLTTLPADEPDPRVKHVLACLNVAKGALFGSGGLLVDDKGETHFHHSPRLSITSTLAKHFNNYTERPLVRYPFKPDGPFARIETVTSDALNFAWPMRASMVLTNAYIRLLELGLVEDRVDLNEVDLPILMDPLRSARLVGQHGKYSLIELATADESQLIKPLSLLKDICEKILKVHETEGMLDAEMVQVLGEIIYMADMYEHDPLSASTQVESEARKLAMQKFKEKKNGKIGYGSEQMCRFDHAWDWIGGGIAQTLRHKNKAGWLGFKDGYSALKMRKRLAVPPQNTRAKLRGKQLLDAQGKDYSDWSMLQINPDDRMYVHPLCTKLEIED